MRSWFTKIENDSANDANENHGGLYSEEDDVDFVHSLVGVMGLEIKVDHQVAKGDNFLLADSDDVRIRNIATDHGADAFEHLIQEKIFWNVAQLGASKDFPFSGEVVNWCFHNVKERLLTRLFYHIWQLCTHLFTLKANYFHLLT